MEQNPPRRAHFLEPAPTRGAGAARQEVGRPGQHGAQHPRNLSERRGHVTFGQWRRGQHPTLWHVAAWATTLPTTGTKGTAMSWKGQPITLTGRPLG